jgi:hypothetical protein
MLWGLAGQYDYQIVHQLFLDETSLAVVVFDPNRRSRFEGVAYWVRALRRVAGENSPRVLVAGRIDRGGIVAGAAEIQRLIAEYGFLEYFATSARSGEGVEELRRAIMASIAWQKLPVTKSPELWTSIREYLLNQRYGARVIMEIEELRAEFRRARPDERFTDNEFDAVLANAQAQGLVWKFPFSQSVLLKPELMNACASAVALAALTCEYTETSDDEAVAVDAPLSEDEMQKVHELEKQATATARIHARDCDVFFSYSSSDRQFVQPVCEELERRGIIPWFDRWKLLPGDRFRPKIESALVATKTVVVFVGRQLGWFQEEEVDIALNLCARQGIRVIPVLLPEASRGNMRPGLSIYVWVDFSGWPSDPEKIAELERGIRAGRHEQRATTGE